MSAHLTAIAWSTPLKSHSQKLVMLALADSSGVNGRVSIAMLAAKTGLSPKTTRAALAALEKNGHVEKSDRAIIDAGYSIVGEIE